MSLRVECFGRGGRSAASLEATRVLVSDAHGNPVLLAVEYEPGKYLAAHLLDDDFEDLLATFGLKPSAVKAVIDLPES